MYKALLTATYKDTDNHFCMYKALLTATYKATYKDTDMYATMYVCIQHRAFTPMPARILASTPNCGSTLWLKSSGKSANCASRRLTSSCVTSTSQGGANVRFFAALLLCVVCCVWCVVCCVCKHRASARPMRTSPCHAHVRILAHILHPASYPRDPGPALARRRLSSVKLATSSATSPCHIIIHTMSHHHTYYVTSSVRLATSSATSPCRTEEGVGRRGFGSRVRGRRSWVLGGGD